MTLATKAEHMPSPDGDKRGICDYCGKEDCGTYEIKAAGEEPEYWCQECIDWLNLPIDER